MKIIHGMKGLGDNIYQRAFVKALPKPFYLQTPWAELYEDIAGVFCTKPRTTLRTQLKNIQQYKHWHIEPLGVATSIQYGRQGIINGMRHCFGVDPVEFDLPDFGHVESKLKYAVVRPVTHRTEWLAQSRSPDPSYVAQAADILREMGYLVVSVADLEEGKEWAELPLPYADVQYHKGELNVRQLLALIQNASVVVGGVGWIVPAAIAAKVPAWIIHGGQGGFNSKEGITDPCMDLSRIEFVVPDRFCKCYQSNHQCSKTISNHANKFTDWIQRLPDLVARERHGVSSAPSYELPSRLLAGIPRKGRDPHGGSIDQGSHRLRAEALGRGY
jgi:hypothetical protein